jgi:hypothetical protein
MVDTTTVTLTLDGDLGTSDQLNADAVVDDAYQ